MDGRTSPPAAAHRMRRRAIDVARGPMSPARSWPDCRTLLLAFCSGTTPSAPRRPRCSTAGSATPSATGSVCPSTSSISPTPRPTRFPTSTPPVSPARRKGRRRPAFPSGRADGGEADPRGSVLMPGNDQRGARGSFPRRASATVTVEFGLSTLRSHTAVDIDGDVPASEQQSRFSPSQAGERRGNSVRRASAQAEAVPATVSGELSVPERHW